MRRHFVTGLWTALILALFFIGQARAQTQLTWDSNGNLMGSVSQAQINQFNRDLTAYNQARQAGAIKTATLEAGKVKAARAVTLGFGAASGLGKAAALGMEEFVRYPLSSIGKGMVTVARATPTALVGTVAASLLLDASISYVNNQWVKPQTSDDLSQGYQWQLSSNGAIVNSPEAACVIASSAFGKTLYPYAANGPPATLYYCSQQPSSFVSSGYQTVRLSTCQSGYTKSGSLCVSGSQVAASDSDMETAITNGLTAQPTKSLDVLNNIYENGGWVPLDAADQAGFTIPTSTVDGKPTITTTTSTAADGSTLITTKTTTPKATVSSVGNTVTNNTLTYNITNVTTSVTRNEAGDIVGSETTTEDRDSDVFSDAAMPDVPKLYTQKYPDGIAGVWAESKPDITSTGFYQGIASMFPSFGGGQCPVWRMSFNLGALGNFGMGDLSMACWIWQALGLVIMATAAFTARKIIF